MYFLLACSVPTDSAGKPTPESAERVIVDSVDTGETADAVDSAETGDTVETADTGDSTETGDPVDTAPVDGDGDGFLVEDGDCDDADAAVHPGAADVCNGIDDNCARGEEDATDRTRWFVDADGDGYGGPGSVLACEAPSGFVAEDGDCDDADNGVHPGATELCDAADLDEDCDGLADDADASAIGTTGWFEDADGDGYGNAYARIDACDTPVGYVASNHDCDDTLASVNPAATEVCDDENLDEDCDGTADDADSSVTGTTGWPEDHDGDGYGSTVLVSRCDYGPGVSTNTLDCDDTRPRVSPLGAEVCDSLDLDEDCDGLADDADPDATGQGPMFVDADGDGHGRELTFRCDLDLGYAAAPDDCDDGDATINPDADEVCDEVDNDCDDDVDEEPVDGLEVTADEDRDGYGAATGTMIGCVEVGNRLDCDDVDPLDPIVVDADGHGTRAEWLLDPVETIQEAIELARLCVVVEPGTYPGEIDFEGHDLSVVSRGGQENTIIEAGRDYGVRFQAGETGDAVLDGFTITGGIGMLTEEVTTGSCGSAAVCDITTRRYFGGGVYVDGAAPTLRNLTLRQARLPGPNHVPVGPADDVYTYSYGGGIYVGNSASIGVVAISAVELEDDWAAYGGGLCVGNDATVVLQGARFSANGLVTAPVSGYGANGAGIAVLGSTANLTAENVLIADSQEAGAVYIEDGTATFTNVTVVGDDTTDDAGAGFSVMGMGSLTLRSAIVEEAGAGVFVEAGATFTGAYNNVSSYDGVVDPTGSDGNISVDPGFVAWTDDGVDNDDLHLGSGSPSIDAGDPTILDVDGTGSDQGAYGGPGGE